MTLGYTNTMYLGVCAPVNCTEGDIFYVAESVLDFLSFIPIVNGSVAAS